MESSCSWREVQIPSNPHVDLPTSPHPNIGALEPMSFRGSLEIPGLPSFPEQGFILRRHEDRVVIENQPAPSWPKIQIECSSDLTVKGFALQVADDTVDGWLLHTRVSFSLLKAGEFFLRSTDLPRDIVSRFDVELDQTFFRLAKIARKLKFVEETFDVRFSLPDKFPAEDLSNLEIVFRGITEGQFSVRSPDFTFPSVSGSYLDLTKPPFEGCGPISAEFADRLTLFGERLQVGPMEVHLEKAELANPRVAEHIRKGSGELVDVRFEVLDNQVVYRFRDYVRQPLTERLEQFKRDLALEEPPEMVRLVAASLQGDVSELEAGQIAMGWTFYSNLPDRYCPQQPEIDPSTGHWRVPIWLVYASGGGGHVGDLLIHKKTGVIVSHTSIEELRSKAMALAETLLHAG